MANMIFTWPDLSDTSKPMLHNSLKRELIKLTKTEANEQDPLVSPDGKKILFRRGRGQLVVANISAEGTLSKERNLRDGWATPSGLQWSPDSRYLAYSLSDLNFNSEVYIHPVDTAGQAINVSMHPRGDYSPYWSKDGSKLGFLSSRNDGDMDVWFVWLRQEDWLKTKADREEGYYFNDPIPKPKKAASDTTQTKERAEEDEEGKDDNENLKIDFENIYDRIEQVTSLPGDERRLVIGHKGETFYFTGTSNVASGSDLYQVQYDGSEIKALTSGGTNPNGLRLAPDGKSIYYLKSGKIYNLYLKNQKKTGYSHKAVMTVTREEERQQIFEEAWSALNEGFYDPNFHGHSWQQLKEKYEPWAMAASTSQDFRDMFNLMLGELNASHMGIYGSDPEELQRERTGLLGAELKPSEEEGVLVTHVVPNTPADRPKSKLRKGDRILMIDGNRLENGVNIFQYLQHKVGDQVLLKVADGDGKERELVIRPDGSIRKELYEEWVKQRQELTDEYSNGRLGYIHIQGMNKPSFERFERELMASGQGKEGIVIDVRFNGGGWTTDYLMAVLTVRQHAYTIPRGAAANLKRKKQIFREYYPYSERLPLSSWVRPSVALCNQSSYSNAEIFSHAFKNLDIGNLVGMPTFGAVISTGGQRLLDGSFVRMPFRGWYVKATDENMENGPAIPDVIVENAPAEKTQDNDTQLKSAVDILLMDVSRQKN
ncbi:MAG: S41 family peptidase [Owenweeksia sp.]|nr:S41 family peptidase [Owenweeksia sp.]